MTVALSVHSPDILTWIILGTFAAFWIEEFIQMIRRRITVSQLVGRWEHRHLIRHVIVGLIMLFLAAHLVFFP